MCKISNKCSGCKEVVFFSPLEQRIPVRAESERMDIHYLWCRGGREGII